MSYFFYLFYQTSLLLCHILSHVWLHLPPQKIMSQLWYPSHTHELSDERCIRIKTSRISYWAHYIIPYACWRVKRSVCVSYGTVNFVYILLADSISAVNCLEKNSSWKRPIMWRFERKTQLTRSLAKYQKYCVLTRFTLKQLHVDEQAGTQPRRHYCMQGWNGSAENAGSKNQSINHLLITKGPTGHLQCYTKTKNTVTHNDAQEECQT